MNGATYDIVAYILQVSQAHNITIEGSGKYNVPSQEIIIDPSVFGTPDNLTSYATAAISGADDFNDGNTTIKDVFDIIVNNTREVTPTCEFSFFTHLFVPLTWPESSRNGLESWVRAGGSIF